MTTEIYCSQKCDILKAYKNNLEIKVKISDAGFNLVVIWVHECPKENAFIKVKRM